MEKDDLKLLWKELHENNSHPDEIEIKKTMNMQHSKRISNILSDRKKEVLIYSTVFAIFIILMIYAFTILKIHFSFFSFFLFSFVGMFLFFKTTHSISTFIVLSRETGNISVSESSKSFYKMLKKIQIIDFITNIIFFYSLAAIVAMSLFNEKEILSDLNLLISIICIVFVLLFTPWLIKWIHNKRYKRFYSKLNDSMHDD